jgi:hypothetical protein
MAWARGERRFAPGFGYGATYDKANANAANGCSRNLESVLDYLSYQAGIMFNVTGGREYSNPR